MSPKFSLDEYTEEEKQKNGNGMYGGKRHDEICDYLQHAYQFTFTDSEINNISIGIWLAIGAEKKVYEHRISQLEKMLMKACDYIHDEDEEGSICDEAYALIGGKK